MKKLLIWDLDGTIWNGTFVYDGTAVKIKPNISHVLETLVERGILNSIASRNDKITLTEFLKKNSLLDFFVFPQISWDMKDVSVQRILEKVNVLPMHTAFIDDDAFERGLVASRFPEILMLDGSKEENIASLLDNEEFKPKDVRSGSGRARLEALHTQEQRDSEESRFENRTEFLKSCDMVCDVHRMRPDETSRVIELINRTNQLNLTANRYQPDEFEVSLECCHVFVFSLKDRFGEYGIIGVVILQETGRSFIWIKDFVLSCRAMNRGIEQVMMSFVRRFASINKFRGMIFRLNRTPYNESIQRVFNEFGFHPEGQYYFSQVLEKINCKVPEWVKLVES